jgi:hypothetical protein
MHSPRGANKRYSGNCDAARYIVVAFGWEKHNERA